MKVALIGTILLIISARPQEPPATSRAEPKENGTAPGREEVAQCFGIVFMDGVAGTMEGHAIADLNYWISWGDYDLACVAFRMRHSKNATSAVRYVHAWAQLKLAVDKKKSFDRALKALDAIPPCDERLRRHVDRLAKAARAAAPCSRCAGEAWTRCVVCHGSGVLGSEGCETCSKGRVDCVGCDAPKAWPKIEDIVDAVRCEMCEGRGLVFRNIRVTCMSCNGVGQALVPKAPGAAKGR